ncbi:glycosyltransferase [uncultured Prevotella sp.]|uniref:glycosyltransferase n=1 Tax=uncultured Prevotella sp. TaxID=159272 RepID=UPI00266F260B|nr:glycosyltransferase [uncultured Prevotella sp.]
MKPHILINMHYLEIGGAETALIGLLNALDPKRVDVDLFLHDHRGEMIQFVPEWVNVLPPITEYTMLERPIKELVKRGHWLIAGARLWAKYISKKAYKKSHSSLPNAGIFHYIAKYTTPLLPKINPTVTYDLAISFLNPHQTTAQKVNARKRIAWIHTDYTKIWVDANDELPVWSKYDYIASISPDVTKTFLQTFPSLANTNKIIEIENILSPAFVRRRADIKNVEGEMSKYGGEVKLLSIGRFSEAKNYDNMPDICQRMVKEGVDVKWFIIGFGGDEQLIRRKIEEAGMQEHVIILGKRSNPYPYIKACDIYVQPSRYEGKSVTVREAQMLCKPVVVTNYPTASSQIKNGIDGVIVPMDNEGCARGLAEVVTDKALQERLVDYLKKHDYGNESEVDKVYRIAEEAKR